MILESGMIVYNHDILNRRGKLSKNKI